MPHEWDVLIIGAGPAGTACGKKLVENGFSVKIYDRRQEIGSPKRCGEGMSETIQDIIGKIPERCIAQKIKGARVYAPNGKYLEATLEYGGFVLERKVFDKWLAEESIKAGAVIQANTFISSLIKDNGYFTGLKGEFLGEDFEDKAKMIVCATGAESSLRKQALGIFSKPNIIDSCLQYEMSGIGIDSDFIHIFVGGEIAKRGYCLTPETEVFTKEGNKAISDVKIGEEVWSMLGWIPVSATSVRDYDGEIISITPSMLNRPVKLTPDHLIYVWNKTKGFQWKKASELVKGRRRNNGDYLVFPIPIEKSIKSIKLEDYVVGIKENEIIYPIGRNQFGAVFPYKHGIKDDIALTGELMEFFGYFVSEGSVNSNGIIISNTNKEIINRVALLGEQLFGFKPSIWVGSDKDRKPCIQVHFASKILKQLFSKLFRVGCRNKQFPYLFLGLDYESKRSFLKGLFRGDGSKWKSSEGCDVLEYSTTSKELANDLWILLSTMNIVGAISKNKKKNSYRLRIRGRQLENLTNIFELNNHGNKANTGFFIKDNMIFLRIRELRKESFSGKVYDLESAGSFCPGFIVHNCWVFPKGKERANVGVGVIPGEKSAKFYLEKFINDRPEIKKGSIIEVNAGCVPVGDFPKNMVTNGFLVCGEAAHHVNPIHGGGIKEAIVSGRLAADVIIDCLKKNDVSQKALSKFNETWWEERGNLMKKVEKLREVVEKLSDDDLNGLADALKSEDLIEFSRGSKLSVLAKVLMRKPKLMALARYLI
jgi:flavin-dependent dehydrogenase/intein/homing endonuclease